MTELTDMHNYLPNMVLAQSSFYPNKTGSASLPLQIYQNQSKSRNGPHSARIDYISGSDW